MTAEDLQHEDWSLYPNIQRLISQGVKFTAPSQENLQENHSHYKPEEALKRPETEAEFKRMCELHPHLWKSYTDLLAQKGQKVPAGFDLYPSVLKEFKDGHVTRAPTDAEKEEYHRSFVKEDQTAGSPDMYPQNSRHQ